MKTRVNCITHSLRLALRICVFAAIILAPSNLLAQNLEKIGKKDMITVGGSMNVNSIFYDAQGMISRRDPFTWYFNGALNVTILDVSLPFTFNYSNQQGTYTQPFNMQSCSPKYKWAQAHIGTTALTYSPYTLAGHMFTGAGIELTPNGFYIGGMYGRLKKTVEYDFTNQSFDQMSFKRMGYAFKAGYDNNGNAVTVSYFHAADELNSLVFVPLESNLAPMENTAVGISGKTRIWKVVNLEAEFAASGLTRNSEAEIESTDYSGWQKWMLTTRTTTEFYKAWKVTAGYTAKSFAVSLIHEHVDPGYQTLGAYFFNNDLENLTIAPSFKLLKGKLNVGLNSGFQKNNLAGDRLSTTQRWVGSANINFVPSKKWVISAAYSNFTSYTRNRPQADPFWTPSPADTLSFYQVAQQGNGTVSYLFGKEKVKQSISVITSYQVTGQQQSGDVLPQTAILNGNLSWSIQMVKSKFSVTVLGNYNQSDNTSFVTQQLGPGVQLGKSFMQNRVRISAGGVYNRSIVNSVLLNHIVSYRSQFSFTPKVRNPKYGRPSFSMNAVYVNRLPVISGFSPTKELTVTVNVGYSF